MEIRSQMIDLVARQRALMTEIEENEPRIRDLERALLSHVNKTIRPFDTWVHAVGELMGGSRTSTWDPKIYLLPRYVRHPAPKNMDKVDLVYTRIEGKWYWTSDCRGPKTYRFTVVDLPAPFDTSVLEALASQLAEELGIPMSFEDRTWKRRSRKLRSRDDLQAAFPDLHFVEGGNIDQRPRLRLRPPPLPWRRLGGLPGDDPDPWV